MFAKEFRERGDGYVEFVQAVEGRELGNGLAFERSWGEEGMLQVPNLLGIRLFALLLGQNSVATNAMFDNRGTAILLAVRLVFCSAISKK